MEMDNPQSVAAEMNRRALCRRGLVQLVVFSAIVFAVVDVIYLTLSTVKPSNDLQQEEIGRPGLVADVRPISSDIDDLLNLKVSLSLRGLMSFLDAQLDLKNGVQSVDMFAKPTTAVLSDPSLCTSRPNLTLLIYIPTSTVGIVKRATMRNTWANSRLFKNGLTKAIFVMGVTRGRKQTLIEREFNTHRDILQGDFDDNYFNQSMQARLALSWIHENCPEVPFILKASDNAYVNIFDMLHFVKTLQPDKSLIACPLNRERLLVRNPTKCMKGYFCSNHTSFPGRSTFPLHCDSTAYLMSRTTVFHMNLHLQSANYFWLEEVYVTSMLVSSTFGIEYIDLKDRFARDGSEVLHSYMPFEHRNLLVARTVYTPDIEMMWTLTLKALRYDYMLALDEGEIQRNSILRGKWKRARNASAT